MKVSAIAIDIDGTITDLGRLLDPQALSAIRSVKVPVIIATGNTHCFTRAVSILIGSRYFVAENGGVISVDDSIEIIGDRSVCDEAFSYLEKRFLVEKFDSRYRLTDLVLKMGFDISAARDYIKELGLPVELVETGFAVHIKNKGLSKGTGLEAISKRMGLDPDNMAAIGDSPSDLPLFEVVGFSAAVGNADQSLKGFVNYVSSKPFGQGFAQIVDHMRACGMIE